MELCDFDFFVGKGVTGSGACPQHTYRLASFLFSSRTSTGTITVSCRIYTISTPIAAVLQTTDASRTYSNGCVGRIAKSFIPGTGEQSTAKLGTPV